MVTLVGRDAVLAALQATVDGALRGRGRFALLEGEPGSGRTALARVTADYADAQGMTVAWGTCRDGGVPGFWPWTEILRLLGRDAILGPTGTTDRFRRFMAVADTLAGAAARKPLLVVLDDLDRIDRDSLHLLEFVTRHRGRSRLCVVGTTRADDPAGRLQVVRATVADMIETHRLTGLPVAEVGNLLGELGADLDPVEVHRATGGNPFAVRESAAASTPMSVGDAVAHRLASLPPDTLDQLATAALLGPTFDERVLPADSALAAAVPARVIRPAGAHTYAFEHDLLRAALAGRLTPAERRCRHGGIAAALERRPEPDLAALAFHYGQAWPDVDADRALAAATAAARVAARSLAFAEETRHRRTAAQLSTGELAALGDAARRAGDECAAREAYLRAADDPAQLRRAALGLHELGRGSGRPQPEATALLERARAGGDPIVLASLARELAAGPERDPVRARGFAAAAVAMAAPGPADELAFCLCAEHDVRWGPGTARERLAIANRMAAVGGPGEVAFQAGFCRFIAQVDLGDPGAATTLRELARIARMTRAPRHRYLVLTRRSTLDILRGDYDSAAAGMEEALALGELLGDPHRLGIYLAQQLVLGLPQEGMAVMGRLARDYPWVGPPELEPELRAMAAAGAGDPATGVQLLRSGPPPAERVWHRWQALCALALGAEVAAAARADDLCRSYYDAMAPYADEVVAIGGGSAVLGPVSLYLGLLAVALADHERAVAHFANALATAQGLGARPLFARIREQLATIPGRTPGAERGEFRQDGEEWTLTYRRRTVRLPEAKGLHDLAILLAAPGEEVPAVRLLGVDATDRSPVAERARTSVTARIRDSLRRIERLHPALGEHLRRSITTGRTCAYRPTDPVRWTL